MPVATLTPLAFKDACRYITEVHRHHRPPQGHKFSVGATVNGELRGVVCVGRPVARMLDDGKTAEVTRLATDGTPNLCSLLYGAAARAAEAMGYEKIITYTLPAEGGASLRASNWVEEGEAGGGHWGRPSRGRTTKHPTEAKTRWSRELRPRRAKLPEPDDLTDLLGEEVA